MANDWTKNPIEIDTAESNATVRNVTILEWHPSAEDDDLEVQDSGGNVLWKVRAQFDASNHEADNILYRDLSRRDVNGINVVTIDGGILYIHIATRYVDQR